jgi:hypothetical protein
VNQLGARSQTFTSRWSVSVLLVAAVVGVVAAVRAGFGASVRGGGIPVAVTVGLPVAWGPAMQATGGLRWGWPWAVAVRARGPPVRGAGGRCRSPCPRCICVAVRDVHQAGRGRCGTGYRRDREPSRSSGGGRHPHPVGSDPDGLPVPAEQESNDAITRSARTGRRPGAAGGSRAHEGVCRPSTAVWRHMHRLTSSSRANDLKR